MEWVHFNVGGKALSTTRDTLTRREPGSVLGRMFDSDLAPAARDHKGRYLLDRPPKAFGAVLDYLRTGVIDRTVDRLLLIEEASFWHLPALLSQLRLQCDFQSRERLLAVLLQIPNRQYSEFVGIRFCGLDLSGLQLEGSFIRCDFTNCDMRNVRAEKANFSQSSFENANLDDVVAPFANFNNCNMNGCRFRRAQLCHVIFQKAQLAGADFYNADLQNAHMQDANMKNCIFTAANLEAVHFGESDCRGALIDWSRLGRDPFFRGVWVTQNQYDDIPRPDKDQLKLRVISENESESMKELMRMISEKDFVVFGIAGGQTLMTSVAETNCLEAVALVKQLEDRYTNSVTDVVGKSALIDDLFQLTGSRFWPKVFFRGTFIGGLTSLKSKIPTL